MTAYGEKNTCISGIGQSAIRRQPQEYPFELALQACEAAVADAGLQLSGIDGVATWPDTPAGVGAGSAAASIADVVASLGLSVSWHSNGSMAAQLSPIMNAVSAISAGYATHVLCWRSLGERSVNVHGRAVAAVGGNPRLRPEGYMAYMLPYWAMSAATWCAVHASAHMHRYGTTKEQMGAIPINQRKNAALNEKAIYRDPISMQDYLASRAVCTPFNILDCDVPCDGTTAFVVSRLDTQPDLRGDPLLIEAIGAGTGDRIDTWLGRSDFPKMAMHDAAKGMWQRTDLKPADVDTAHLYDGFSFLAMLWLEAMGFCGEGESGAFIEGGERIALSGDLPMNTNGGQLSEGRLHGFGHLHEACLQLRGEAGARQVADVQVSAIGTGGGNFGGAMLLRRP